MTAGSTSQAAEMPLAMASQINTATIAASASLRLESRCEWRSTSAIRLAHRSYRRRYSLPGGESAGTLEQLSGDDHVAVDRRPELRDGPEFVGGVRDVNGSWTEKQGLAPGGQKRDIGRVGKHNRVEAAHGREPNRRSVEDMLDGNAPLDCPNGLSHLIRVADRAEHHLCFRGG